MLFLQRFKRLLVGQMQSYDENIVAAIRWEPDKTFTYSCCGSIARRIPGNFVWLGVFANS